MEEVHKEVTAGCMLQQMSSVCHNASDSHCLENSHHPHLGSTSCRMIQFFKYFTIYEFIHKFVYIIYNDLFYWRNVIKCQNYFLCFALFADFFVFGMSVCISALTNV